MGKCCKTTGYYCFQKGPGDAKCMKSCKKGVDSPTCAVATTRVSFQEGEANSLFCFSVYTKDTGSTKPSYELELVTQQYAQKVSIFACDAFDVYSDVSVDIGGLQTIKVDDVKGDFHFQKRKETGTWINTGMFKQVWKAIGEKGAYNNFDWTVKVDPDAVFLPRRLIQRIKWIPRLEHGVILVNCKLVDNGFFGNLEVYSANAFSVLVDNIDKCDASIPWKIGVKNGKYGPMGEDLFAENAWKRMAWPKLKPLILQRTGHARQTVLRTSKKIRNGNPCARTHIRPLCTHSRHRLNISNASKIRLPCRYHNELVNKCIVSCRCPMRPECWTPPSIFVLLAWSSAVFLCRRQCTSRTCGHFSAPLLNALHTPPLLR